MENATHEVGLFKLRKPTIPPTPPIPVFGYVIDIYSDKVVITNPDGTTTQLSTISDLNNWLSNITGRKIRVNANVEVYDDLILTPNEYWIFGEWIHGNIYLLGGRHTIISFTRLGDDQYLHHVSNYDPVASKRTDVSGLKLYSVYADLNIRGTSDMILRNVLIYVEQTYMGNIEYVTGDLYIRGTYANIMRSTLHNAYIDADYVYLTDVTGEYKGTWVIIGRNYTEVSGTVDASRTNNTFLYLRRSELRSVAGGSSVAIDLLNIPPIDWLEIHYRVLFIGVRKGSNPYYYDPLPSGVTYQFDEANRKIIINNITPISYNILLTYEVSTYLP
jgi:hypothetical protein